VNERIWSHKRPDRRKDQRSRHACHLRFILITSILLLAAPVAIEARLWDVVGGRFLSSQQYRTESEHWRQIGHIIADTIYTRLTGRDGRFEADNPE
jgi:hypothetical protein